MELSSPLQTAPLGRRQERGAAVFVVVMAIVLLSGLGVWAVRSSSLVDLAAGFRRESRQTQYIAEMGVHSSLAYLSIPGVSSALHALALRNPDHCGSVSSGYCKSIPLLDIDNLTTNAQASAQNPGTGAHVLDTSAYGSLGPYASSDTASGVEGDFYVEMTDPRDAQVPGVDLTQARYKMVTLTSVGVVRPTGSKTCDAKVNASAGRLSMRAQALVGPIF